MFPPVPLFFGSGSKLGLDSQQAGFLRGRYWWYLSGGVPLFIYAVQNMHGSTECVVSMQEVFDLIAEYKTVAAKASQLEHAIVNAFDEVTFSGASQQERVGQQYRIVVELGYELAHRALAGRDIPGHWYSALTRT